MPRLILATGVLYLMLIQPNHPETTNWEALAISALVALLAAFPGLLTWLVPALRDAEAFAAPVHPQDNI